MFVNAEVYDALYAARGKDYAAESARIIQLIRARRPEASSILDVACGTGQHLAYFTTEFAHCAGIDVDPRLLAAARERAPTARLVIADMTTFRLDEQFDAVVCLFSAIGYARTPDRLAAAITSMAAHLRPGGVLIVEPWLQPDVFQSGLLTSDYAEASGFIVTRFTRTERRGAISMLEFHYLIGTTEKISHVVEQHEVGLFSWEEYAAAFTNTGLAAEVDQGHGLTGRGLVIGRKTEP